MWSKALIAFLFCAAVASADSAATEDLADWRHLGELEWSFEGGVVYAGPSEQVGFLVSPDAYSDFTLEVEFWVDDETNSGIFIHCTGEPQQPADLNPDDCYEVNIWDNHPVQDFRTGSIVKRVVPTAEVHTFGKWNTLAVRAVGGRIDVTVNGVPTATLENAKPMSGVIALQYAGKRELRFRNLSISNHRYEPNREKETN